MTTPAQSAYAPQERGDRLRPGRSDRCFWVLTALSRKLQSVIEALPSGDTALDFGCAERPYEPLLRKRFDKYVSADLAGNDRADLVIDEAGRLPSPGGCFDCVLSSQVLEHVASPGEYLSEAFRLLCPGGSLVLSTHGIWRYHPDPIDYWRWTAAGLRLEIERVGFEVVAIHSVLGPEATALQLWQDSTLWRVPKVLRPAYIFVMQLAMRGVDGLRADRFAPDSSVFLVWARRSNATTVATEARGASRTVRGA